MKPKFFDILALLISLLVLSGISVFAYQHTGATPVLELKTSTARWLYPLETDRQILIDGPLGQTVVQIQGGQVFVTASPCREKICVRHPPVSRTGEWIACLPNQVLININAQEEEAPDAISF